MINILFSVILINWKNQTLGFSDCFENVIRFWYLQRTVNATWTYQFKRKWRREDLVLALDLLVFSRWNNVKNGWELCYAEWRSNQLKGKKAAPQFAIDASVTEKERVKRYTVRESEREEERERGRKKLWVSEEREREQKRKGKKWGEREGGRLRERE